jgi:hypothetical protein
MIDRGYKTFFLDKSDFAATDQPCEKRFSWHTDRIEVHWNAALCVLLALAAPNFTSRPRVSTSLFR